MVSLNEEGYNAWSLGDPLALVVFLYNGDDGAADEFIYEPSEEDIQSACVRYGLPWRSVVDIIQRQDKSVSSIYFDVERLRNHLEPKEESKDELELTEDELQLCHKLDDAGVPFAQATEWLTDIIRARKE